MRPLLVLLTTLAGLVSIGCASWRGTMDVTCYSGGQVIYRGKLTSNDPSARVFRNEKGQVVLLSADCVGLEEWRVEK